MKDVYKRQAVLLVVLEVLTFKSYKKKKAQ